MLDSFEILTTSGVVLWSKSYAPVKDGLINGFIKDVFIEETVPGGNLANEASATQNPSYKKEKYTLRWTSVKDLGLIFVAVYQSLLHLTWIDQLLDNVRVIFTDLYGDQLRKPHTSVVECDFGDYFEQQRRELEGSASFNEQDDRNLVAGEDLSVTSTPDTSRPSTPGGQVLSGSQYPKGTSRRARKAASNIQNVASSGDETKSKTKKDTKKRMRRWDDTGAAGEDDGETLDYSTQRNGTTDKNEITSLAQESECCRGKVLTKADLEKPMRGMEEHLLKKNVAREAAVRLCESVERELIGVRTGNFECTVASLSFTLHLCLTNIACSAIEATVRTSLSNSLRQLLTPTTSLDILRAITSITQPPRTPFAVKRRPYVISIVGVNGVGKSTNLSKLAFFLLQNKFSLLVAACDTFRSGAVEQLRVHARNLKELSDREHLGKVELYERGYGKDAANIAKDAISYADTQGFDVVLIDTAGRRHNDTRLMSSLEKFAQFAKPDKILMVGEALVGTDSVAQARAFDTAFGRGRRLDGFIISKCDTVGEMVGTLVSMVHATGIPVVFLGVGQHYGDLRTLVSPVIVTEAYIVMLTVDRTYHGL
ncbi:uncharacterized protein KY384_006438 [Bacidia gigantensis]|uniref:uncharacterized protein n=1 Tax=Bacidia gigantensis TaxID=2732470 RepID=UPI001D04EA98|nr:uncharacterized protein KY384_006438 [Bacidia gigantensis]KAG8528751.1 hypothetical protein KY384_006438 [Bacidia gigantensis]